MSYFNNSNPHATVVIPRQNSCLYETEKSPVFSSIRNETVTLQAECKQSLFSRLQVAATKSSFCEKYTNNTGHRMELMGDKYANYEMYTIIH